jgi:hypothetical protein
MDPTEWIRRENFIYPGDPSSAGPSEGELPRRLEGLEELVGLEESAHDKRVHDAQSE